MRLSDFDYYLPPELIAQEPVEPRDQSRLLVLHRDTGCLEHHKFIDLVKFLKPGDVLVSNNTKVIPARLFGLKENTGANIEVVLLKRLGNRRWECLVKPGKRIKVGTKIIFGQGELVAEAIDVTSTGERILEFSYEGVFEEVLERLGKIPLPPYITRELAEPGRYQTVYARNPGSAAAPTAGLHFTDRLLKQLEDKGIQWIEILLHVGLGTFRPVKSEDITRHKMHEEYFEIPEKSAEELNKALEAGQRIISVGTTSTRALESAFQAGKIKAGAGTTGIFIYPGYEFKVISGLITNFHLPKSTLLMLVSALAGRENILKAYQEAVKERYRFFSFGDAMLII
ncbi:MAG: tRNA preQ1(34) S-adenosylmethionine ribosyltransferase-isomerase QueA [Bacillota bacterium]|uniref:S-adenosylmethionine:tRNA ribosyltransferase-isomerase n=1 Tax=Thermanaerosceptrum fracticalcis TaxID=1712410 RepID=A0A7G6E864_THEFR|nr:tRNA preQ1(34) S-adenosylmethionine ribosyltransferase-isomerase QueA [Thermanaerosceptrum fracticalcis]QNB48268.1 tRNA preQ1(34) S-adenosylmethionine ribosyltransferase-isomerase QueA [Thermanaerosceptrum fracticalcis]